MRVPAVWRTLASHPADYIFIVMTCCSFGLGILGIIFLSNIKNLQTEQVQPHIYAERDRDAERVVQQRKLASLQATAELTARPRLPVAVAAAAPRSLTDASVGPSQDDEKDNPKTKRPDRRGNGKREDAPPAPKPSVTAAKPASPGQEALIYYITDEIATLNLELRGITNRLAVTDANIKQMREAKSWYEWLALGITLLATLQGIATILMSLVMEREKKPAVQEREAPSSG